MTIYANFSLTKGNVNIPNYKNWVAIQSLQFGAQRYTNMRVGTVADRNFSYPQFSEVTLYKKSDTATVDMFSLFCSNEVQNQVEIDVCTDTNNNPKPTMKYIFYDVAITKQQHYVNTDSTTTEEITLNYKKMEISYTGSDEANKTTSPKRSGYDLEKAKKL